jgi:hypothetical protein
MAGFRSVKRFAEAWDEGRSFTSHFRKSFNATTAGWADFSMQPGGPPANFYASSPLEAATLNGSRGFYIGDAKSPSRRFLTGMSIVANNVNNLGQLILFDYVLYYPFIDCDDTTAQVMTNDVTIPRYATGDGIQVVPISLTAHTPPGGSFTFEYVNQAGVTKTSQANPCSPFGGAITAGTALLGLNNAAVNDGLFCKLAAGDSGVRRINSVTFSSANGGLMALVLVRPLVVSAIREASVETEVMAFGNGLPPVEVFDGAYLNLMHRSTTSQQSTFMTGKLNFIWDEGT